MAGVRRARVLGVTLALATVLAGCAGEEESTDTAERAGSDPTTTTPAGSQVEPSPSAACGVGDAPAAGTGNRTMTVAGVERTYRLHLPDAVSADEPLPLVFDLHGLTQPADVQAATSAWEELADREGIVVVTPQGLGPMVHWEANLDIQPSVDVEFLLGIIDEVGEATCLDTARVYAGGISNGGLMASALACHASDRIAAVGLVSGVQFPEDAAECPAERAVPVIAFYGTADSVLPYEGGLGAALGLLSGQPVESTTTTAAADPATDGKRSVDEVFVDWTAFAGCDPDPTAEAVSDEVERRAWTGCRDGAEIELWVIEDGGHNWPGSEAMAALGEGGQAGALLGRTTMDISATAEMWEFYSRHPLEG